MGSFLRPPRATRYRSRTSAILYDRAMPIGYPFTPPLAAVCTFFALAAQRPRRSSPSNPSYWLAFLVNEVPFVLFYVLVASTLLAGAPDDVATPVGWVALGVAAVTTIGLGVVVWRGLMARGTVDG